MTRVLKSQRQDPTTGRVAVTVTVTLVGNDGGRVVPVNASLGSTVITGSKTVKVPTGADTWTMSLVPNDQLSPAGTMYRVVEVDSSREVITDKLVSLAAGDGSDVWLKSLADIVSPTAIDWSAFGGGAKSYLDLEDLPTLGTAAAQNTSAFEPAGAVASEATARAAADATKADASALAAHVGNTSNPHAVTKAQVGLGNVDNTADSAKPVSTAQAAADAAVQSAAATDATTKANAAAAASAPLSHTHTKAQVTDLGTIGTAAALNVPASGNAASGEVVKGSDTRLTDARTPTSHTHAESEVTGLVADLAAKVPTTRTVAGLDLSADRSASAVKTALSLTKSDVGLGNVDNTSDANKPVSTAQAAADALALAKASNLSDVASAATARTNLGAAAVLTRTAVKTTTYTAALWDLVPIDTSGGAFTLTLPAASGGKGRIAVKWIAGTAAPTLALTGTDKFNLSTGATSFTMSVLNQGYVFESDGSGIWTVTADDLPLSQLDLRFYQGARARILRSGRYYGPGGHNIGTGVPTQSVLNAMSLILPQAVTVDRIGVEVTTAVASSTVRLGIYTSDSATDGAGTLVLDAGTIDASTTGAKEITISQALSAGLYWLAAVSQGGAPTLRLANSTDPIPGQAAITTAGNSPINGIALQNAVTGALPSTPSSTGTPQVLVPRIFVRIA